MYPVSTWVNDAHINDMSCIFEVPIWASFLPAGPAAEAGFYLKDTTGWIGPLLTLGTVSAGAVIDFAITALCLAPTLVDEVLREYLRE